MKKINLLALLPMLGLLTGCSGQAEKYVECVPLILVILGIVYIVETLSVILQVGYFKLTHGKRIFKMAPIHHHYEMCGWSEEKIVFVFAGVSALMCLIAWFGVSGRIG